MALIGELFPADPVGIGALLAPMGLAVAPQVPSREWRDLYGALDCAAAAALHPFYVASIREFHAAGRPSSAPRRSAWTARRPGSRRSAPRRRGAGQIDAAKARALPAIRGALEAHPIGAASPCRATKARNCWSRGC